MKKKILAITGIRSEYDILYPVLKEIKTSKKFDISIVLTGAHLSDWHGNTGEKIKKDGFQIVDKIDSLLMTNRKTQRSKAIGILITALTQTVERVKPDLLLFVGDREESIATCIVANYMNVLVAHIGGGDPVYGNADDPIRFACSKIAHIHFTTSKLYAQNLIKLGEEKFRICFSGNPAYKNILETKKINDIDLGKHLGFDIKKHSFIVLLKHPISSELDNAYKQMKITLSAVKEFVETNNLKVVGIYPNTDPGAYNIIEALSEVKSENIKFFKSIPRDLFINMMKKAICLVGNSSMGILEAPLYKLPVVNIGNRQKGRLNAGNVDFVNYKKPKIVSSLNKACFDIKYRKKIEKLTNPYGDSTASKKILDFLEKINFSDKKWYTKKKLC